MLFRSDFNFCSAWRDENDNIPNEWVDCWPALEPDAPGYTQDTEVNAMLFNQRGKAKRVRFDRILLRSEPAQSRWRPMSITRLGTAPLNARGKPVYVSDHFGLLASIVRID